MTVQLLTKGLGLNINADPAALPASEDGAQFFTSCDNVFIGDTGRVNRCIGAELLQSGNVHTVFRHGASLYFAVGSTLYEYIEGGSPRSIGSLPGSGKQQHTTINNGSSDVTFLSDGTYCNYLTRSAVYTWDAGVYRGVDTIRSGSLSGPPPASLLAYGLGRMWAVSGQHIYPSEPNNPYLFHLGSGRLTTETPVTCLAFVKNGFWLGTTGAIYYVSSDGVRFERAEKAPYGCFAGTPPKVDAAQLPLQGIYGEGYIIPTEQGFAFIGQDGIFINLTEKTMELKRSNLSPISMSPYVAAIERNRYYFCGAGYSLIMNLYNLAVTEASLFDMTDCAVHNGLLYFGNSTGLHRVAQADVEAEFTFQVNFPTPIRLRSIGITGEFEGRLYLDATADEKTTRTYQLEPATYLLQTSYTKVLRRDNGKAQHWKLRFYTGAAGKDFSIDKISAEITKVSTLKGGYTF